MADPVNSALQDFMMNKGGNQGGGGASSGGGRAPDDKDHAKVAIDAGIELAKLGVKLAIPLPINLDTPEDSIGKGLSLTHAPLKADSTIPSVVNNLQGGDGFILRTLKALIKDGSIKNQAEGVEGNNALHTHEAASGGQSNIEAPHHGLSTNLNGGGHGGHEGP